MAKGEWKWYLLPGILGIVGGAIGWFMFRKKNNEFGLGLLYFSIAMTILSVIVGFIVGAIGISIGNQILTTLTGGTL
jgi:hypothetical protein